MHVNRRSAVPLVMTLLLLFTALSIVVPLQLDRPPLPPEEHVVTLWFRETLNDTNNEFEYTLPYEAVRCEVVSISTNGSPVSITVHNTTNIIIELRNLTSVSPHLEFETTHSYLYYVTITRQTQRNVHFNLWLYLWFLSSSQPQRTTFGDTTLVSIIAAGFAGIVSTWFIQKAATLRSLNVIKSWRGRRFRNEIIPLFILILILVSAFSLYPLIAGLMVGDFEEVSHKEVLKTETHSVFLNSENPIAWVNITVPNIDTWPTTDDPMFNLPLPIYLRLFDISTNGQPILINRIWEQFILHYEIGQQNWWIKVGAPSGAVVSLGFELVSSDAELSFSTEIYRNIVGPLVNPMFVISSALLGVSSMVFSLVLARNLGIDTQAATKQVLDKGIH